MDTWFWYLTGSLIVTAFVLQFVYFKRIARRWIIGLLIFLAVAITAPTLSIWAIHNSNMRDSQQKIDDLVSAFDEAYNKEGEENEYNVFVNANPLDVWLVTRGKLNENGYLDLTLGTKTCMLVGDIWLELQTVQSEETEE